MFRSQWRSLIIVPFLTVLPGSVHAQGLRDVKSPVPYPSYLPLFFICAAVVVCAAVFCAYRWGSRKRKEKEQVVLRPWEKAFKHLEELDKENLLAKELYDRYYSALSDILRRYIEEQLHIRAPEMTTEEFLQSLRRSSELNVEQKEALKNFLESCDLVKFAKYAPDPSEAKQGFELARQFVEETRPKETLEE